MARQIGDRVGAIMGAEGGTVTIFGYGTYQGLQIPDPALQVQIFGALMDHANPCIKLDSGKLVFGCECWWASETAIRAEVAKYTTVTEVDIEEERRKADQARMSQGVDNKGDTTKES